jgi:hypothetical protein
MQGESKVVDLVAMAGLGFGLRGKERLAPMLSSRVAGVAPATKESTCFQCFSLIFLFTRCPCASNDINEMIYTSMHVIYAAIETRVLVCWTTDGVQGMQL